MLRKLIRLEKRLVGFMVHLLFSKNICKKGAGLKFNYFSFVRCKLVVGDNVNFNGAKLLGAGQLKIGHNFHSGERLVVLTSSHNYKGDELPYDRSLIVRDVEIGDNVWVGMNVLILPGATIGEGAIVQAGSVVHGEVPRLAIVGGNPAKVIKFRDSMHYDKLKEARRFA